MGKRNLKTTLILAFLTLNAVSLLITSSLNVYFNFQNLQELIIRENKLIAQKAANAVSAFMRDKLSTLEKAVVIGELSSASPKERNTVFEKLLGREISFRQLVLFNEQGQELLRTSRISKSLSPQLMEYNSKELLSVVNGKREYISSVYIDKISSEPMTIMAVPVTDMLGDIKGVLVAEVNLKFMWNLIDGLKIGENGLSYVVDKQGTLIAFKDISRVLKGDNLIHLDIIKELLGGNRANKKFSDIARGIQGTWVLTSYESLGTPDWSVVIELPVIEAYESVIKGIAISITAMALSLALSVFFGIYLSKKITQPIISLRDATKKISKGDMSTEIKIDSQNEIGDLALSFNQMITDLHNTTVSIEELKKAEAEKEKLYKQLLQSEKMIAVGRLAGGVAHEINNPLAVILGYSQLLLQESKEGESIFLPLKSIEREVLRCKRLVEDLLTFSRKDRAEAEKADINAIIDTTILLVEPRAKICDVKIVKEYAHGLPQTRVNKGQIEEVIINLCNNAIDAMPGGGTIKINTRQLEQQIEIEISDTGEGMPKEIKKHIFEPFFTTKEPGKGTGLGLSLCYDIIEKHNGKIEVESEVNQGTTFKIKLPVKV